MTAATTPISMPVREHAAFLRSRVAPCELTGAKFPAYWRRQKQGHQQREQDRRQSGIDDDTVFAPESGTKGHLPVAKPCNGRVSAALITTQATPCERM